MDELEPPVEPGTAGESLLQATVRWSSAHAPKVGANSKNLDVEAEGTGEVQIVSGDTG